MKKNDKKILIFIIFIIFILFSLSTINSIFKNFDNKNYNISVIFNRESKKYNELIKKGIELASYEMGLNITYIETDNINCSQNDLIDEEINKGADGLIILPNGMEEIYIKENNKIPIVLLQDNIDLMLNISYINSDNFKIGTYIADEILKNGNTRSNIILIEDKYLLNSKKQMYEGFYNSIKMSKNNIEKIIFDEEKIYKLMINSKNNIFVTFEPQILEQLCKIKKTYLNYMKNKEIYGVSRGNNRIKYLEEEIVTGIIVQNEFSMGYLGVARIKKMIRKENYQNEKINFSMINKRNMYLRENQYLLFPFK